MKLHLPKLLRNAVLACFAAVSGIVPTVGTASLAGAALAAFATKASALESTTTEALRNFSLSDSFAHKVRVNDSFVDVSYDAETGLLTGYSGKNGLDVNIKTTWKKEASWGNEDKYFLAYADRTPDEISDITGDFGLMIKGNGSITGYWQNEGYGDTLSAEALKAFGKTADLTIVLDNGKGVFLKNDQEELYANANLKSGGTNDTVIRLNKSVINSIAFIVADGSVYSSGGVSVERVGTEHVNATIGELTINGGNGGNGASISAAGSDIYAGGSGLLFLQTKDTGAIELTNDIYLGSSSHAEAASRGVMEFGNDAADGATSTLGGTIYVLEDSSIGARGTNAVIIEGDITDRKMIDGSDSTVSRSLTIKSNAKGDIYSIAGNVTLGKLTVETAGVTLGGAANELSELSLDKNSSLTIAEGASLSVAGAANINTSIVNKGTLLLDGLMTIDTLREFDFEYTEKGELSNGSHGYRTAYADYKIVVAGDDSSLQLGENFVLSALGKEFTSEDYRVEDNSLILNIKDTDIRYEIEAGCQEVVIYDGSEENDTSRAAGFILNEGTSLQLNAALQASVDKGIAIADGAAATVIVATKDNKAVAFSTDSVKLGHESAAQYVVNGGLLNIQKDATISSLVVTNGGDAEVQDNVETLGSRFSPVEVELSQGGKLTLNNGNEGVVYLDATVKDSGALRGTMQGNKLDVRGTITGSENSVLNISQIGGSSKNWKISADITGGVAVTSDALLTLTGNSSYTGGTTITAGKVVATSAKALGDGGVTLTGKGKLTINSDLLLGGTLKVGDECVVMLKENRSIVLGSLDGFEVIAGAEPTGNGLVSRTYKIIDAADAATVKAEDMVLVEPEDGGEATEQLGEVDLAKVYYLGQEYGLTDGNLRLENVFYVVKDTADYAVIEETNATSVNVSKGAMLQVAGDASIGIANAGTVHLNGSAAALSSITNTKDGVVRLTNANGYLLGNFSGSFCGCSGSLEVVGGTNSYNVRLADDFALYASKGNEAGTYDLSGGLKMNYGVALELDGHSLALDLTLDNGSGVVNTNSDGTAGTINSLAVTGGSATVKAESTITLKNTKTGTAILNVGSNTLNKKGSGLFEMEDVDIVGNGKIDVQGGELRFCSATDGAMMGSAANVTVQVGEATLRVDTDLALGKLISSGSGVSKLALGNDVELVLGSKAEQVCNIDKVLIEENAQATLTLASGTTFVGPDAISDGVLVLAGSGTYKQTSVLSTTSQLQLSDDFTGKVIVADGGKLKVADLGCAASVRVDAGGALTVRDNLDVNTTNNGTLVAGSISAQSFLSTGGSLELTDLNAAITSEMISISGTTLKGSWSASGAVLGSQVVVDAPKGKLTLDAAELNATVKVNNGTLVLTGTTLLGGFSVAEGENLLFDNEDQNGFAREIERYVDVFDIASGATVVAENMKVGGYDASVAADGSVILDKGLGTMYWVTTGEVLYNDQLNLVNSDNRPADGFVLNGGSMIIAKSLGEMEILVKDAGGRLTLQANQTLKASALSDSSTGLATLSGFGTYDIGTELDLSNCIELGNDWNGVVSTDVSEVEEDKILNLGNDVEFTNDSLTLGGVMSTAGQVTMGDTLALTTHKAGLVADTLVVRGESLAIDMDAEALSDAVKDNYTLLSVSTVLDKPLTYDGVELSPEGIDIEGAIGRDGLYIGKFTWDGTDLKLSADLRSDVIVWSDSNTALDENMMEENVAFLGEGSPIVIADAPVSVKNIIVSNHTDGYAVDYTFAGKTIEADSLKVSYGAELSVTNHVRVSGETALSDDAVLIVSGDGASYETGSLVATDSTVIVEDLANLKSNGSIEAGQIEVKETSSLEAGSIAATKLVNNGSVTVGGVLTASAPAAAYSLRSTVPTGGVVENAGNMVVGGVDAAEFKMTAGTLQITSDAGFKAESAEITGGKLIADTTAWGIEGASVGGVTIAGSEQLTLTDTKLVGKLVNEGNLVLSGTVDVSGLASTENIRHVGSDGLVSANGNGYVTGSREYKIATGNAVNVDAAEWYSGAESTYEYSTVQNVGTLIEKIVCDWTTYVVNTGMTYDDLTAGELAAANKLLTRISANGGTLDINAADMAQRLTVDGDSAVVNVNAAVSQQILLNAGTLNINSTVNGIKSEGGTINLASGAAGEVKVTGSMATISGGSAGATLAISSGVTAYLDEVRGTTVKAASEDVTLNGKLIQGVLSVAQGSELQGSLSLDKASVLRINAAHTDTVLDSDQIEAVRTTGVAELGGITNAGDIEVVGSLAYDKYFSEWTVDAGGSVVATERNLSYYSDKATAEADSNATAGLKLADEALVVRNPQTEKSSELNVVLTALDQVSGEKAEELGASLAGASTAVLGMATMGDLDRQLRAIRNRTTSMGVSQEFTNDAMPYVNAWINAEGDRSELADSDMASGYEMNSWGGTVGFDVDFCPSVTAGMALTAMYGDLTTTGADAASGDMDTYYLSVFARYSPSAWTHTFVATVGKSDISLDRTVAGIQTSGETKGTSFGFMYEVGRVIAMNEDASTCLQPVFNVTWRHTTVDGYTEDGGDIALDVDEQSMDTVTFGVGARLQSVVGESMYNRASILEARVLAKFDAGDRSGSSDVSLMSLPGSKASVESAERGAVGLEAGIGLTIPTGQMGGSIFVDGSVELRSDYTNMNGTVGYRINF